MYGITLPTFPVILSKLILKLYVIASLKTCSSPVDPETGSKRRGRVGSLILLTLLKVDKA